MAEPLVVVVHRYGQNALCLGLANHVLVKNRRDFLGRRQAGLAAFDILIAGDFVADDVVAQIDAFITDKTDGPAMSFFTSCWLLPQKRAVQQLIAGFLVRHRFPLVVLQAASVRLLRTLSIKP